MRRILLFATFALITTILSSCCVKYKNLVYIQDKYENASDTIATSKNQEIVLRTGDNLYINLIGANISDLGIYYRDDRMGSTREFLALQGYMIDPEGNIKFPMIGDVKLAGLTLNEARDLIQSKIDEYIANVVVAVRLLNYDITVLGEVARPGTYTFTQREVNLFDALGMAGDCTPNADRQRVIILRKEAENTKAETLNLLHSDFVSNPYFWLKPNDVIYVKPTRSKTVAANSPLLSVILSSLSVTATLILYISYLKK
ncbi:MAG: polysaccharide biosynthesis/export family protein [Salinivirgaceae bacterium]|nr:polysaccharide biosynthesis/export family protein [Salinivirgaceae bacterium]MBR2195702.1 polysaccharide biosynthesis/export family protein [Salinivirgaceae bacterium]MBR4621420.1 polysaccharide biosynthesis/export family protein [Salinivirgaceae bacterium]